eukprot:SAG11_NODE_20954_length_435_cov_0.613095_1_plen_101_part_10
MAPIRLGLGLGGRRAGGLLSLAAARRTVGFVTSTAIGDEFCPRLSVPAMYRSGSPARPPCATPGRGARTFTGRIPSSRGEPIVFHAARGCSVSHPAGGSAG